MSSDEGGEEQDRASRDADGLRLTWTQLNRLLAYIDEMIICIDADATISFASAATARLTGHEPSAVVGRSIAEFVHPDDLVDLLRVMERWHDRQGSGIVDPARIRAANGDWIPMTIDGVTGVDLGPLGTVIATLRPVDATSEIEQELRQRLVAESRLVRIASTFVHTPAELLDDNVDNALAELGSMGAVDRVEIVLFDGALQTMSNTHEWTAPGIPALRVDGSMPIDDTPMLRRIREHREVNIPSVADLAPDWGQEREWFEHRGVRSMLAVPLADQGRVIGMLGFEAVQSDWTYSAGHLLTLRTAAGILGQAFAKREAEERLAFQARHDPLTGLPNRWAFLEALQRAVRRLQSSLGGADPNAPGVAVLLFDLDRFKVVNDSLGHRLGDELLVEVARRVADACPPGTLLARMGGDELVILAENLTSQAEAMAMARELRKTFRRPLNVEGHEVATTASVGIAFALESSQSADDLLRHADSAMYAAKELGRDRIEVFDETLRAKVRRQLQNEIELRQALDHGELVVHYQPEVEVPSGKVLAVEALVRWHHPHRGLLAAAEFIGLAEETGIIIEIGLWVLREACAQHVRWQDEFPDHQLLLRVNLSALQLGEPDLLPKVMRIIHETGIEPSCLCLEITETVVMADAEASLEVLQKLRGLGVELAIDDFGTGYSSLSYLKRLPVDVLKIDRSFVDGLGTDPDDTAIVQAIMVLASSLGLSVTAEGVETDVQLDELMRLGCRRVQGYLFGRPGPADAVSARL
jgi:diguanylate cyclase (GGDEF)-like protein/PAS domain S-box-containing protein